MKNSKRFSAKDWRQDPFLTTAQVNTCNALFAGQTSQLPALAVIDLVRLNKALENTGLSLATAYLDPAEQERLASFRFSKRQSEWLGGRLAAKQAAISVLAHHPCSPQNYQELRVEATASGRPYLRSLTDYHAPLPDISISHSSRFAGAVAVGEGLCGLDLQQITPQVIKVRGRFTSDKELELLNPVLDAYGAAATLSLLWSAKEALRKALTCQPLAGFSELSLQSLTGDPLQGISGHFTCPRLTASLLPVFMAIRNDFVCAITILSASAPSAEKMYPPSDRSPR